MRQRRWQNVRMDLLDTLDDVCDRCGHTLDDAGACPPCGWVRERFIGPLPPYEPDDLPAIETTAESVQPGATRQSRQLELPRSRPQEQR